MINVACFYAWLSRVAGFSVGAVSFFSSTGLGASVFASTGLRGGKFTECMAPVGHTASHLRHRRHFWKSMYARLFVMVMASKGHSLAHFPHPIQAAEQALRATAPLSLLTQLTNIRRDFGPLFRNSMIPLGQAFTQAPHAVHNSSSTSGKRVSGLMRIAPNEHAFSQSPFPRQPYEQPVSPLYRAASIAQLDAPS